ncbi:MAG TPA: GNAT family N-acetyltransferase [Lapillicoccus sp.]|nr:GNAT family N-acetyltransferase [Lapillicoccus sp.]
MPAADPTLVVRPANEAACADLDRVFGTRGAAYRCQCQRYKLAPRESFGSVPVEDRADRLRDQTGCGDPDAPSTSGLVAYLDGEPVGWCAVEPRPAYQGLLRVFRTPWEGRAEDRSDASVWAVTCLFARAGYRRRGVSRALARAAVELARDRGARAVEAYPMTTTSAIAEELHVGTVRTFADAGLVEVSRPSPRRVVMRLELRD